MTMFERCDRAWFLAAACALSLGCSAPSPEAPASDAATDLGAADTSTPIDGALSPDVVDVSVAHDRGRDAEADASLAADVTDASTTSDVTSRSDLGADVSIDDARAPADSSVDAASTDVAAASSEFAMLYETIFRPRCAIEGCHIAGSAASRLTMPDAATTYARLVNVHDECSVVSRLIRVVPFDPSVSAIMLFNDDGLCGRRHGAFLPSSYGPEQRVTDHARLEAWIMAGAR